MKMFYTHLNILAGEIYVLFTEPVDIAIFKYHFKWRDLHKSCLKNIQQYIQFFFFNFLSNISKIPLELSAYIFF